MGRVAPRMIPTVRLRRNYRDQWEIDQRRQQAIRLRLRRIRGRYGNLHNHWRTVRHPFPKRNHQDTNRVLQSLPYHWAIPLLHGLYTTLRSRTTSSYRY